MRSSPCVCVCVSVCVCVYIYKYPYAPCMKYVPTFTMNLSHNVGKYVPTWRYTHRYPIKKTQKKPTSPPPCHDFTSLAIGSFFCPITPLLVSKGKVGYPWESTRYIYINIYIYTPTYTSYVMILWGNFPRVPKISL